MRVFGRDARLLSARPPGPVLALLVITLAGAALRVWLIDARPLIGDEALTWRTSGRSLSDFLLWRHHGDHPPLFFMLVRLSLEAFGQSVWSLRSPSAIAGILCIPMAWLLGRRFGAGLLLATLVAFDPVLVVLSSLARMYALLALLILAALLRMDALVARDERRAGPWLGLGAILLAATWTHYLGFALAAAILLALAWQSGLRPAFLAAIPPLVGALPPLARAVRLLYLDRPTPLDRLRPVATSGTLDGWEAVRFVIERAADHWTIGVAAPLLTLVGLIGVVRLARRSAPLAQAVGALAVLTLVAVIAGAPGRPFGVDRYLVPWRLAVSIGLAALALLPGRWVRAGVTAGAALLAVGGIRAAAPGGDLPGVFAIGALSRSLVAEIGADEIVAFEQPYLLSLGIWYGLPVESVGAGFPRRPDGSLPARTWLLVTGTSEAPTVPGLASDRGRYRAPVEELTPVLEAAYRTLLERDTLDRALRGRGAAAIEFAPGRTAIHAPAP
jgi:4-amino-4-deoxy-L-arabinose transferase-like glycosyltransferase